MSRPDRETAEVIRRRAGEACEYCRAPQAAYRQRFCLDHVIARQHGGPDEPDNLAFCCLDCNLRKGPNIAGLDPATGRLTPLFHPRLDRWTEHFAWRGATILGTSPVGRATVAVLDLNHPSRLAVRDLLITEGMLPPPDQVSPGVSR